MTPTVTSYSERRVDLLITRPVTSADLTELLLAARAEGIPPTAEFQQRADRGQNVVISLVHTEGSRPPHPHGGSSFPRDAVPAPTLINAVNYTGGRGDDHDQVLAREIAWHTRRADSRRPIA